MSNKKSNKYNKVLKGNKKKRFRIELLIPVLILVFGIVFIIYANQNKEEKTTTGNTFVSYHKLKAKDGVVRIPVSDFNDYKARYFRYKFPEKTVYFFGIKSTDGIIRAAFDACDVCYRAKKGYSQQGDNMICNNCGLSFPSNRINVEKGGCNPAPLARKVEGRNLVINVTDIYSGKKYF